MPEQPKAKKAATLIQRRLQFRGLQGVWERPEWHHPRLTEEEKDRMCRYVVHVIKETAELDREWAHRFGAR